jgi:hypothetical protein
VSEWIGLLGCSGCWGTLKKESRGAASGWPRWRRGGGRRARRGGVAREGGVSARGSGSRGSRRCHVRRWGKQEVACGLPRRRRQRSAPAAVKQRGREVEDQVWTDLQNLKSSRVPL